MAKKTKKAQAWAEKIDSLKKNEISAALELVKEFAVAKFDEGVDVSFRLGIDPRKTDQMVRGSVSLPNGTGKTVKVLVFAKGDKEKEALDAGADFVGGEDLMKKIQEGWLEFDRVVATPDMMGLVGRIGRVLGPRGLMPNPKVGTVTFDVANAVKQVKAGQVQFRTDKGANVHMTIGKASFTVEQLAENAKAAHDAIQKLKPSSAKGTYVKNVAVSSTMGPGVKVDPLSVK